MGPYNPLSGVIAPIFPRSLLEAFAKQFLGNDGSFPSGTNQSDVDKFVLQKMFTETGCDGSEYEDGYPVGWFPKGWMAFQILG